MRALPGLGQLISASRRLCLAAWPPSVFARSFPRHSGLVVGRLGNVGLPMKQSSISNYFSTKGVTPGKVQASGGIGRDSPGTPPVKRARTATTSPKREANTTQEPEAKPKKRRLQKRGAEVKGGRTSKTCEEGAAAAAAGLEDALDQPVVHHRVRTVPPAADAWGKPPGASPPGALPLGVSPKQDSDENVSPGSEGPVLKAATPAKSAPRSRRSAKKAVSSDSEGEAAASSSSSGESVESGGSDAEEVATGGGGEAAARTKGKAKQRKSKKAAGSAFDKLMEKKPAVSEKVEGVGGGAVSAAADYRNFDAIAAASWAPGEPVPYGFLADTFEDIAGESKRLLIIQRLVACFRTIIATTPQDLLPAVYLCSNKVAPAHEGLEMGVGDATLIKALAGATGRKEAAIKKEYEETGDLGVVACSARATQRTMFQPKPLTLAGVLATFKKIALVQGQGTQEKRKELIVKLLVAAKQGEAGYIARSLQGSRTGRLRIGLAEKSMLVALAHAVALQQGGEELMQCANTTLANQLEQASAKVRQAYSECPSFDVLVPALLEHGHKQLLQHCHFIPGVPIAPMLAKPTSAVSEVLDKFTDRDFTCEFKYDGERAQVHVLPGTKEVRIYSRNMENNSGKYPDVAGRVPELLKPGVESVVLDGELVAFDPQTSAILPFQVLSTRARKDVKLDDIKVQVVMYVFDCLFLNGRALLQAPLHERRDAMHQAVREQPGQLHFATTKVSTDLEELQKFLDDAVEAGTEGLIVKTLNDTYEPSKRSSHWLKLKKDYLDSGGDSFDVVPIGAVHGKGKRAGLFGAFLLAVYNEEAEEYQTISKLGTGFSEEALKQLSEELRSHQIDAPRSYYSWSSSGFVPDVWFAPSMVWEVKAADLSISPVYTAAMGLVDPERGISIRFPRLLRVREDKKPEDATSAQQVAEMYSNQATAKPSKKAAAASDEEE